MSRIKSSSALFLQVAVCALTEQTPGNTACFDH